jgi:hypothetical protein
MPAARTAAASSATWSRSAIHGPRTSGEVPGFGVLLRHMRKPSWCLVTGTT